MRAHTQTWRPAPRSHCTPSRSPSRRASGTASLYKFAVPSAHRRVSSSLLAPAGPPGAPASPICYAFAGSPGQDRWFPWGPGVFHLSRFRWPPWSRLGPKGISDEGWTKGASESVTNGKRRGPKGSNKKIQRNINATATNGKRRGPKGISDRVGSRGPAKA